MQDIASIIASIATLSGVLGGLYLQIRTLKQSTTNARKIDENTALTAEVKEAANGLTEKLVASTRTAAKAEGILEEKNRALS